MRAARIRLVCFTILGVAVGLLGCSSSAPPPAEGCAAQFSGNVNESATLPTGCSSLSSAAEGDAGVSGEVLSLRLASKQIAALAIDVKLGFSPSAALFSSETVTDWSVVGLGSGDSNCGYGAGSGAVPTGSFTLNLTSVSSAGGASAAHGSLEITMYVHAPPGIDCGMGDIEDVQVAF